MNSNVALQAPMAVGIEICSPGVTVYLFIYLSVASQWHA
jgi:hypothetical protein